MTELQDSSYDPTAPPERPVSLADGDDLTALVETYDRVLVEFYTDGCGVCASMEPVLGNFARASEAVVGLINPRDDPPLVEEFQVKSVPLFVVFVDGEPVDRLADGFQGMEALLEFVEADS